MDDKKYYLAIVNDGDNMYGYLSDTGFNDDTNRFDPLTVFGELLSTALDYEEKSPDGWLVENYSFKEAFHIHPFFKNKKYQDEIETYRHKRKTGEVIQYGHSFYGTYIEINGIIVSIARLHECFLSGKSISLSDLELVKAMNKFRFTFEVESKYENPYYRNGGTLYDDWAKKPGGLDFIKGKGHDIDAEFVYYGVDFGTHVDTKQVQNYLLNSEKNVLRFSYTCYSLEEALFALWHYLIFHDYTKFNKCHHCGTYFATKTLKQKYCTQNSPYEKYIHLDCKQAVRNIKLKLARRRKVIYTHLNNYYSEDTRRQFERECDLHEDKIKSLSSIENLKAFERTLDKQAVKEKWYTDENKKKARTAPAPL